MRIPITQEMLEDAQDLFESTVKEDRIRKWGEPWKGLIGALGELEVLKFLWTNNVEAKKATILTHDIDLAPNYRLEVKTQRSKIRPELHYGLNFNQDNWEFEEADFIFFTVVQVTGTFENPTFDSIHLFGGCSKDKFLRLATENLAGTTIYRYDGKGNKIQTPNYWKKDSYEITGHHLTPALKTVEYFRTLQTKENQ